MTSGSGATAPDVRPTRSAGVGRGLPHKGQVTRARPPIRRGGRLPLGTRFVYAVWFIVLCAPQWWMAQHGAAAILKVPTLLFGMLLVATLARPPRHWFAPLLAFVLYTVATLPFAADRAGAIGATKALVVYYVLAIGTMSFLGSARRLPWILSAALMWSYIWWVLLGAKAGQIAWHPALGNYDAFGPLMVMGMGSCYYYGMASRSRNVRWVAFAGAAGCTIGLVSSVARGAVLSGVLVVLWVWMRSKRKMASAVAVALAGVAVVVAAAVFQGAERVDGSRGFWTEMSTVGSSDDATASDRQILWALAIRVFKAKPLFGVGAESFGAYAADTFRAGDVGGSYDDNPKTLWGRRLHSTYFQLLCEYGLVGCSLFLWLLFDFRRRNRALRSREGRDAWAERTGGALDLYHLSLALEVSMVGYLATGLFYNQIFDEPWLYVLVIVNALLHVHSRPTPAGRPQGAIA